MKKILLILCFLPFFVSGQHHMMHVLAGQTSTPSRLPMIVLTEPIDNGNVFVSTNGGDTFIEHDPGLATAKILRGSAISYNIRTILIVGYNTYVQYGMSIGLENEGFSVYPITQSNTLNCGISDNGTYLAIVRAHSTEIVYYSTDGGSTLTTKTTTFSNGPYSIAFSNSGRAYTGYYAYPSYGLTIHADGLDGTSTVKDIVTGTYYPFVACSSDGSYVYAGKGFANELRIHKSSNSASTFDAGTVLISSGLLTTSTTSIVHCSADGQYVLAHTGEGAGAYVSSDYGVSYTRVLSSYAPVNIFGKSVSHTGRYMIMGDATTNNQYYVSSNYGVSWSVESTPTEFTANTKVSDCSIQD